MKKPVLALLVLSLFSCGKVNKTLDKIDQVPEKLDGFSAELEHVNYKANLQGISTAEDKLLNEENANDNTPIPYKMLSPAQVLATLMNSEQALNWVKVKLAIINTSAYTGKADDVIALTDFNAKKKFLLTAVTFVSGFLPEKTINEIVDSQIRQSGYYRSTALSILQMKAQFTHSVLLGGLFSEKFSTLGHIKRAIAFNSQLEAITQSEFAHQISLTIVGFVPEQLNQAASSKLDKTLSAQNWSKIKALAEEGIGVKVLNNDSDLASADKAEYASLLALINSKIKTLE